MKSFQIRKWQDNYAEDCSKLPDKDENLVNAVLECANQLAEINERFDDIVDQNRMYINTDITGDSGYQIIRELKSLNGSLFGLANKTFVLAKEYDVKIFGIKLFSIVLR